MSPEVSSGSDDEAYERMILGTRVEGGGSTNEPLGEKGEVSWGWAGWIEAVGYVELRSS